MVWVSACWVPLLASWPPISAPLRSNLRELHVCQLSVVATVAPLGRLFGSAPAISHPAWEQIWLLLGDQIEFQAADLHELEVRSKIYKGGMLS